MSSSCRWYLSSGNYSFRIHQTSPFVGSLIRTPNKRSSVSKSIKNLESTSLNVVLFSFATSTPNVTMTPDQSMLTVFDMIFGSSM